MILFLVPHRLIDVWRNIVAALIFFTERRTARNYHKKNNNLMPQGFSFHNRLHSQPFVTFWFIFFHCFTNYFR